MTALGEPKALLAHTGFLGALTGFCGGLLEVSSNQSSRYLSRNLIFGFEVIQLCHHGEKNLAAPFA